VQLPEPRGESSRILFEGLRRSPHPLSPPAPGDDPLGGDDFHLCLYVCFELHYRGFVGVDPDWEWEPSLISFRRDLERRFEAALRDSVEIAEAGGDMAQRLRAIAAADEGPSLADHMQSNATFENFIEFLVHRSAYHLKEADPHTWALPRLSGKAKAAMVEIQTDEYGGGDPERMHARLFAGTLETLDLDPAYGAYLDLVPGVTLATVNLMSMFGLNRRLRGAAVGHLALFEMTSTGPNRKYGNGLRRLGRGGATEFFDEHVEADAVHEAIAAHDLAGSLAADEPGVAADVLFGAAALVYLDRAFADHVLGCWSRGLSSLYGGTGERLAS
jgi:hypothetical protein